MEVKLSRKLTLSESQRRRRLRTPDCCSGPTTSASSDREWPLKTRVRIFASYFEWTDTVRLDVVRPLGKGQFSTVLCCKCTTSSHTDAIHGQEVAVKVLPKATIVSQLMAEQICQERRIQAVCSHHRFVLPLLKAWQDDHKLFMAYPVSQRGSVYKLWAERTHSGLGFSPSAVITAGLQLASGLQYIHNVGIIYRDMKLDNILISISGDLQISDFGLSKWLGRHQRTYTICGTLAYMAPEVLQAWPYNHCVDWWSLGVTLFCLAKGRFPFAKGSDHFSMFSNIDPLGVDLSHDNPVVDELLKSLLVIKELDRCTSFDSIQHLCHEHKVTASFLHSLDL